MHSRLHDITNMDRIDTNNPNHILIIHIHTLLKINKQDCKITNKQFIVKNRQIRILQFHLPIY